MTPRLRDFEEIFDAILGCWQQAVNGLDHVRPLRSVDENLLLSLKRHNCLCTSS